MTTSSSTRPAVTTSQGGLLDVDQAAARLGTPTRFIRRLIAERRIRFYKIGRYVRFSPDDLDAFIERGRVDDRDRGDPGGPPSMGRRPAGRETSFRTTLFD